MTIHPTAALRAVSNRLAALDGYQDNRIKILEHEKFTLEQQVAELEAKVKALSATLLPTSETPEA